MPSPYVLLFYKHFAKFVPGMSHIGLGNNALFTAKVLKTLGVAARPVGVNTAAHVRQALAEHPAATHAVIEGTWLPVADVERLAAEYPGVEWVCREHSQIAFLQVQPGAITLFRGYGTLQDRSLNFAIAANNARFARFWEEAYNQPCADLPNLYPLDAGPAGKAHRGCSRDVLRVSSYGAGRLQKNHTTAAAAALMIARRLGRDLELHVNVGREPHLEGTTRAVRAILAGVPHARLVEDAWTAWGEFRHLCGAMDLGLAATHTETFCLTAADHVSQGVPVVGTAAIEWLPPRWQAAGDSPEDVAEVGINLLLNPAGAAAGRAALAAYMRAAKALWLRWLGVPVPAAG